MTRLAVKANTERVTTTKRMGREPDREFWPSAILTISLYQNPIRYCICLKVEQHEIDAFVQHSRFSRPLVWTATVDSILKMSAPL